MYLPFRASQVITCFLECQVRGLASSDTRPFCLPAAFGSTSWREWAAIHPTSSATWEGTNPSEKQHEVQHKHEKNRSTSTITDRFYTNRCSPKRCTNEYVLKSGLFFPSVARRDIIYTRTSSFHQQAIDSLPQGFDLRFFHTRYETKYTSTYKHRVLQNSGKGTWQSRDISAKRRRGWVGSGTNMRNMTKNDGPTPERVG